MPAHPHRPNFFYHLHPPTIPKREGSFRYTFGLGGISVLLFLVLAVTGLLLTFFYLPTPDRAAESIQIITYQVPFGWLVRNLHYWAAQWMVIVVALHMLRVIFTGAYKLPRRTNYVIGLALLAGTLLLNFTGYVLRSGRSLLCSPEVFARLAASGAVKELLRPHQRVVKVTFQGQAPAPATFEAPDQIQQVESLTEDTLQFTLVRDDAAWLNRWLVGGGFQVSGVAPKQKTLKEFFLSITGEERHG